MDVYKLYHRSTFLHMRYDFLEDNMWLKEIALGCVLFHLELLAAKSPLMTLLIRIKRMNNRYFVVYSQD